MIIVTCRKIIDIPVADEVQGLTEENTIALHHTKLGPKMAPTIGGPIVEPMPMGDRAHPIRLLQEKEYNGIEMC